jgi:formylglycine-generating enzyme required for sulfatase activity
MTSTPSHKATVRATPDAFLGLDNPTEDEWDRWHRAMLAEREATLLRARLDVVAYAEPAAAWSDTSFRQFFLFMYDTSFFDRPGGQYRTRELVQSWRERFGRVDSVLLWHAYPRLGFDSRTQFDFYKDMPGGLRELRSKVTDVLHAENIRVLIDYNPWDAGTYAELAERVVALDADGVMLDTMTRVPDELARAVESKKRGVVFAPELRTGDGDLSRARQSWAQWSEVGDDDSPSIYRLRWLSPSHRLFAIRRWDTSRRGDIVYSFFNGSGLILWDNVFGVWNPYSRGDRRLIAETAAILDSYQDLFASGDWLPLVPTGAPGLDANRWQGPCVDGRRRAILTLRNRRAETAYFRVPPAPPGMASVAFWGHRQELSSGDRVAVEAKGVQAIAVDEPVAARRALQHFIALSRRADTASPDYDERAPPRRLASTARPLSRADAPSAAPMVSLEGGTYEMQTHHERRECGCYAEGATDDATWGWFHKDPIVHRWRVTLRRFAMRRTAVTNAEFLDFVRSTRYRPKEDSNFLKHVARSPDGSLPAVLPPEQAVLPVTFVSLDDASPDGSRMAVGRRGRGRGKSLPVGKRGAAVSGQTPSGARSRDGHTPGSHWAVRKRVGAHGERVQRRTHTLRNAPRGDLPSAR